MSSKTFRRMIAVLVIVTAIFIVLSVKTQAATNEEVKQVVYDADYYINSANDLKEAYTREDGSVDEESLYNHYLVYGIREGRQGSPVFDIKYYLNSNKDLLNEFKEGNYARAYQHFLEFGFAEGRSGSKLYNCAYYKAQNADVAKAYANQNGLCYVHFAVFGQGEGRKASNEFDIKCYLGSNKDLKTTFNSDYKAGYKHYALFGQNEKRIVSHDWATVNEEASCVKAGKTGRRCKTCGTEEVTVTKVTGHKYVVNSEQSKPATCEEAGKEVSICSVCNDKKETVLPALNHDYSVDATADQMNAVNLHRATCTEGGQKAKACSRCGKVDLSHVEKEDALGHNFEAWRELTEEEKATYNKDEKKYVLIRKCDRCDEVELDETKEAFIDENVPEFTAKAEDLNKLAASKEEAETLVVPAGTTRKVEGQIAGGQSKTVKITVKGNLILNEIPNGNQSEITREEGATVTMMADSVVDLNKSASKDYITDAKLTSDITISTTGEDNEIDLKPKTDTVIDLDNHKITTSATDSSDAYTAAVTVSRSENKDAVVTIKNGTIEGKERGLAVSGNLVLDNCQVKGTDNNTKKGEGLYLNGPSNDEEIKVVLNNVNIESVSYCLGTNANHDGVNVELNNVTAYSSGNLTCLFFPAKGNVAINGGSYTGGTAIETVSANLDIKGGAKLTSTETNTYTDSNRVASGSTGNGSVIILSSRGGAYTANTDVITVKIASDVVFNPVNPKAHQVEFIENQNSGNENGASFDITWEGHTKNDLSLDIKTGSTVEFVKLNGEVVGGKQAITAVQG